jgi:PIN domain
MISTFTAFIDSNVFYGARLRSLVLFLAQTGLFRARWSNDVHNEWISNLLSHRPDLKEPDLQKTRRAMDDAVLDCLVENYDHLIPALNLPDPNDRHVLAAAIKCHASVIVSFNTKDFPPQEMDKYEIHLKHPDDFILDVLGIDEEICLDAVSRDIAHYKNPPLTVESYLDALEKAGTPKTVALLRDLKIILE